MIDQPREAFISLTRWSLDRGLAGRIVQAVVLPYAEWSILLAMLGLAFCSFPGATPRVVDPAGLPADQCERRDSNPHALRHRNLKPAVFRS